MLAAGRAPHNRIIDQHDAPALEQRSHRVQLQLHTEVADRLAGFDEGSADVMVPHQPEFERQPRFLGKAQSGVNTGIGDRDHDVGGGGLLSRQLATELLAHLVHTAPEDH